MTSRVILDKLMGCSFCTCPWMREWWFSAGEELEKYLWGLKKDRPIWDWQALQSVNIFKTELKKYDWNSKHLIYDNYSPPCFEA